MNVVIFLIFLFNIKNINMKVKTEQTYLRQKGKEKKNTSPSPSMETLLHRNLLTAQIFVSTQTVHTDSTNKKAPV